MFQNRLRTRVQFGKATGRTAHDLQLVQKLEVIAALYGEEHVGPTPENAFLPHDRKAINEYHGNSKHLCVPDAFLRV